MPKRGMGKVVYGCPVLGTLVITSQQEPRNGQRYNMVDEVIVIIVIIEIDPPEEALTAAAKTSISYVIKRSSEVVKSRLDSAFLAKPPAERFLFDFRHRLLIQVAR